MSAAPAAKLTAFLRLRTGQSDLAVTEFRELIAGWSRITYTAAVESSSPELRHLVIQVEKPDSVVVDSSVERDFRVLTVLARAGLPVPRAFWFEADAAVLGGPFIVTELLPGRSFDTSSNEHRTLLSAHWEKRSRLPAAIVEALVAIHATPLAELSFLPAAASADATPAYELGRCRVLAREARVEDQATVALSMHWLERNQPKSGFLTLVHGDFHMRNLLIDEERVSGVLDWEVTRISNPLFDLAYMSIPYLSGKFFSPGSELVGGVMPLDWLLAEYARRTGRAVSEVDFRYWRVLATLTLLLVVAKGVSDFEAGKLTSIRNAWARFSEPVLHEDILNLLVPTAR